jgi:hypothetical protein
VGQVVNLRPIVNRYLDRCIGAAAENLVRSFVGQTILAAAGF